MPKKKSNRCDCHEYCLWVLLTTASFYNVTDVFEWCKISTYWYWHKDNKSTYYWLLLSTYSQWFQQMIFSTARKGLVCTGSLDQTFSRLRKLKEQFSYIWDQLWFERIGRHLGMQGPLLFMHPWSDEKLWIYRRLRARLLHFGVCMVQVN